ncbi:hypothetical protein [Mycolicibacterium sp. HS_4_1]
MSTTLTATFPDLAFTPDTAGASIHGAPTMPMSALAWSLADGAEADVHVPVVVHPAAAAPTTAKPRISRVAIVGMLFAGVTVAAALGAIVLGGNDSPSTPLAVVDHTQSAPYVPPAPAPLPTASHVAAPVPVVNVVTVPVGVPPKAVAPAQPAATPAGSASPKPAQGRPHWNWPRRIWQHHDQDGHDLQDQPR